jgi:hypothetical protein
MFYLSPEFFQDFFSCCIYIYTQLISYFRDFYTTNLYLSFMMKYYFFVN